VLEGATDELLSRGHESAILVNGDSPTLPAALLIETVKALRPPGERVVFVPALDGGYSIVGLKRRTPEIFAGIPWSTVGVMRRSLEQAERYASPQKSCRRGTILRMTRASTGCSLSFAARGRRASSTRGRRHR
jgi:hypothetical protein